MSSLNYSPEDDASPQELARWALFSSYFERIRTELDRINFPVLLSILHSLPDFPEDFSDINFKTSSSNAPRDEDFYLSKFKSLSIAARVMYSSKQEGETLAWDLFLNEFKKRYLLIIQEKGKIFFRQAADLAEETPEAALLQFESEVLQPLAFVTEDLEYHFLHLLAKVMGLHPGWFSSLPPKAEAETLAVISKTEARISRDKEDQAVLEGDDLKLFQSIIMRNDESSLIEMLSKEEWINIQSHRITEPGACPGLLHYAAEYRALKMIPLLISRGFKVNEALGPTRDTPLFYASDPETYQLLLDHGADPYYKNDYGLSALEYGCASFHSHLKHFSEKMMLFILGLEAAQSFKIRRRFWFYAAKQEEGLSPSSGYVAVLERLIELGFPVQTLNRWGENALHYANGPHTLTLLLASKAKLDVVSWQRNNDKMEGLTPLLRVLKRCDYHKLKPYYDCRSSIGRRPLNFDRRQVTKFEMLAALLLKAGANPEIPNCQGMTSSWFLKHHPTTPKLQNLWKELEIFGTCEEVSLETEEEKRALLKAELPMIQPRLNEAGKKSFSALIQPRNALDCSTLKFKTFEFLSQFYREGLKAAEYFFTQLAKLPSETLDRAEKRVLASFYVQTLLEPISQAEKAIDALIKAGSELKNQLGIEIFLGILGRNFPVTRPPEKRPLILCFISIAESLIELNQLEEMSFLTWLKSQETHLQTAQLLKVQEDLARLVNAQRQAKFCDVQVVIQSFRTLSDDVKFPIAESELKQVIREYRVFDKFSALCSKASLNQLKESALQLQQHFQTKVHLPEKLSQDHLKFLAIIAAFSRYEFHKFPYPVQVFALLGLLKNSKGRLLQIRTGEGKSLTMAILAAFLAGLGFRIHIITSTDDLAIRDYEAHQSFFERFKLSSFHVCGNRQSIKKYEQRILYGTNAEFQWILLGDLFKPLSSQKLLKSTADNPCLALVDEADDLMLNGNGARIASPERHGPTWMYRPIFDFVKEALKDLEGKENRSKRLTKLRGLISPLRSALEREKLSEYRDQVDELSDAQLKSFLFRAETALFYHIRDINYVLKEGKVMLMDHLKSEKILEGQRLIGTHSFLDVKEGLEPSPEPLTLLSISNAPFYRYQYAAVFGMSGTLGGEQERTELFKTYGVDTIDIPKNNPKPRHHLPSVVSLTPKAHFDALLKEVQEMLTVGRPVLVLCDSLSASKSYAAFFTEAKIPCQLLNEHQPEDSKHIILRAGHARTLTIATGVAARGTDFILSKKSLAHGGLHVILAAFPQDEREDGQRRGRGERQGQPGSSRVMFCLETDEFASSLISVPAFMAMMTLMTHLDMKDSPEMQLLLFLREQAVSEKSEHRMALAFSKFSVFEVLKSFSVLLKHVRLSINELPFKSFEADCALIQAEHRLLWDESLKIHHPFFEVLQEVAMHKLEQQVAGQRVEWASLLKQLKKNYFRFLRQEWAMFYEKIQESEYTVSENPEVFAAELFKKFHDDLVAPIKSFVQCPQKRFVQLLSIIVGVDLAHFPIQEENQDKAFYRRWNLGIKTTPATTLKL